MKSIEETYRQWFEEHLLESVSREEAKQLDDSWDTIEEELVLDAVWTNLNSTLPGGTDIRPEVSASPARPSVITYLGIPAGVILVGFVLWYFVSGDRPAPNTSPVLTTREDPVSVEKGSAGETPDRGPLSTAPVEMPASPEQTDVQAESKQNPGLPLTNPAELPVSEKPRERISHTSSETDEPAQTIPPADDRIPAPPADDRIPVPPADDRIPAPPADDRIPAPPADDRILVAPADDRILIQLERNLAINHKGGIDQNMFGDIPDSFVHIETADTDIHGGSAGLSSLNSWYFRGFGFVASYKNSWILNDETLAGLERGTLTNTRVSFSPDLGVTALMASRKGHQLELELLLLSRQQQQYTQYINALYQDRTITLSYQKAQLNWFIPPKFLPGYLGFGIYGAHLGTARETIGSETRSIDGFYSTIDYGVSIDYKLEYQLLPHFILAPSLRLQYSLPDIFTGSPSVPGVLRRTHNASAGINLVIYYRF